MAARLRLGTTPASCVTSKVHVEETGMPAQNAATILKPLVKIHKTPVIKVSPLGSCAELKHQCYQLRYQLVNYQRLQKKLWASKVERESEGRGEEMTGEEGKGGC